MAKLKGTPALLLTAHTEHTIGQKLGGRQIELVAKPFDLDDFLQRIKQVIERGANQEETTNT